jgi:hypothetical protein
MIAKSSDRLSGTLFSVPIRVFAGSVVAFVGAQAEAYAT